MVCLGIVVVKQQYLLFKLLIMKNKIFIIFVLTLGLIGSYALCKKADEYKEIESNELKVPVTISNLPTFLDKTPKEGLLEALQYYDIKYPHIVYAQAILETDNFNSKLCKTNNNLFGLYNSKKNKYYTFSHWSESVKAYKDYIQYKYTYPTDYYTFLTNIKYASDPDYISKLKAIVKNNDKRNSRTGNTRNTE